MTTGERIGLTAAFQVPSVPCAIDVGPLIVHRRTGLREHAEPLRRPEPGGTVIAGERVARAVTGGYGRARRVVVAVERTQTQVVHVAARRGAFAAAVAVAADGHVVERGAAAIVAVQRFNAG